MRRSVLGPVELPTAYLITSCPDAVACSSGSAARRPVRIIRAAEREEEVLKLRAAREGPETARRPGRRAFMKADMVNWIREFELIKGQLGGIPGDRVYLGIGEGKVWESAVGKIGITALLENHVIQGRSTTPYSHY